MNILKIFLISIGKKLLQIGKKLLNFARGNHLIWYFKAKKITDTSSQLVEDPFDLFFCLLLKAREFL
jgi:hypothetical protein